MKGKWQHGRQAKIMKDGVTREREKKRECETERERQSHGNITHLTYFLVPFAVIGASPSSVVNRSVATPSSKQMTASF